jgi:PRTRC genetic system protein E
MENLFQELAERFKTGTVNIAVQMDKGTMAVMVTFKGIECAPRVLKGTPEEIDKNFISDLTSVLVMASDINEHTVMKELQAIREKQLAEEKKKENEEKKAEAEKKKESKKQAAEAQTSLLDAIPAVEEKVEEKPEPVVKKEPESTVESKDEDEVDFGDKGEANSSLSIPFRISAKDRATILERLHAEVKEIWEVHPLGAKILVELKNCTQEEAEEAFRRSDIPMTYLKSPIVKEASDVDPVEDQKHAKNVEAMKAEMSKTATDDFDLDDDDFDLNDEPVEKSAASVELDDDDDFEF